MGGDKVDLGGDQIRALLCGRAGNVGALHAVALERLGDELLAGLGSVLNEVLVVGSTHDGRVLFLRALDDLVQARLVEERDRVAWSAALGAVGEAHAVIRRLEAVVGPLMSAGFRRGHSRA
jgi:hypothetical protein